MSAIPRFPHKDKRLMEAEQDFEKFEKLLKFEPGIKETNRLKAIKANMRLYLKNSYAGVVSFCNLYRLQQNRYPDTNIKDRIMEKVRNLVPLFKENLKQNLFS